ncbi:MAG: CHAT domain-containing protein [Planctomycetota bacterium]
MGLGLGFALLALAASGQEGPDASAAAAAAGASRARAELVRAADDERTLEVGELYALYDAITAGELAAPDGELAPGVPWSEPLGRLYRATVAAENPTLGTLAVFAAQAYGTRLDREGERAAAIAFLEEAAERHRESPYASYLDLELGTLLRDEFEFGRALALLERGAERVAALQAEPSSPANPPRAYLEAFAALLTVELGAAYDLLGRREVAEEYHRRGEELARALGEEDGPATWGASLMYQLNSAIQRRGPEADRLRERFESDAWAERIPEQTALQVRARLAIVDVQRAFRGAAPPGSGEEELGRVIEAGMRSDEEVRARLFLATSYLDRGAVEEARVELETALAALRDSPAHAPLRLQALGLAARLALLGPADAIDAEAAGALLRDEVRPALTAFVERAADWPLEEEGVALLARPWVEAFFAQCVALERFVDEGGAGAERGLDAVLRLQACGTLARRLGLEPPTAAELQQALAERDAGLVLYLPGRVAAWTFTVGGGEVVAEPLAAGTEELLRLARRAAEAIASALLVDERGGVEAQRLALALDATSRAFWPPSLDARARRFDELVVIGLDAFGYVPFEALTAPGDGEALGLRHAVAHWPSAPVGLWLARRAAEADVAARLLNGPPVAFAGERWDAGTLGVGPEALEVGVLGEARELTDSAGLAAALGGASLAHLLAHGDYDSQAARPARLWLGADGQAGAWSAADLERLAWPPVVLVSACGAERGRLRRGDDGVGHLRSSFFTGGSVAVVAATLPLERDAAVAFARAAHAALAEGMTLARALRAARREAAAALAADPSAVPPVHAHLAQLFGAGGVRLAAPPDEARERRRPRSGPLRAPLAVVVGLVLLKLLGRRRKQAPG